MAGTQQSGILVLQPQEPVGVPTPPEGSYYLFVNVFDGQTYYKDWHRVCKPLANVTVVSIPTYADDVAAGLGGLTVGMTYQTDGTGANPLNVPGIMMVKQ